jgi:hypothetical protein
MSEAPITGTVTLTFDLDAMIERNDAARQMVSDLCHQRREWMMSIPARRDYDPDLVISASLQDVPKLLLAYEATKERAKRAEAALAAARVETQSDALHQIQAWCDAYPIESFPEQDLQRADQVLRAAGISMSAMHAGWARRIVSGIGEIARAAVAEEQSNGSGS